MDIQPCVTWACARVVPADNDVVPPRRSASLCHKARPDALFAAAAPVTPPHTQAQPFVQPAWVVPRLNGKDALQARNTIRNSRSITQASTPANFIPNSPRSPNYHEIRGPATLDSPMAQDYPESNEEWYGVAVSHLSEPNSAYATSGEEVRMRDFAEIAIRPPTANPAVGINLHTEHGLQPAPEIQLCQDNSHLLR
ncbi:hypothetical protein GG344DRAFT_71253, partial [Lentinula edodes]